MPNPFIEEEKALGALVSFFPEGAAVAAGGVCSAAAIPNPNDPGWVQLSRVESWEPKRMDVKYQKVKDSAIGRLFLANEVETDGFMEYNFTVSILRGLLVGIFFRSQNLLGNVQQQFVPELGIAPRGWIIMVNKDQAGTIVLACNLWGRMKCDSFGKGGGGELIKPALVFTDYENALKTIFLGNILNP